MARRIFIVESKEDDPAIVEAALGALQAQGLTAYQVSLPFTPQPGDESEIAHLEMENQMWRRNRELTALYSVTSVLNQSLDLNTLLQECLDRLLEAVGVETGAMILLDDSGSFRLGASRNMDEEFDALFSPLQIDYKLMHRVMGAGEAVIIEDLGALNQLDQKLIQQTTYHSLVMGPLQAKDRILGGFVLASKGKDQFTSLDTEFVLSIGKQVGMALQLGEVYTELNSTLTEVRTANSQLEMATRHKSEFLANMSHELRTPLNAIIGFSELLQDQTFGPLNDKQLRYVENILNSGKHLLALVNDVLDLSKVEAGKMELQLDRFPPAEIVNDVLQIVAGVAVKKQITLASKASENVTGELKVLGDRGRLKQILYNLFSNAIKFTPEGGAVQISSRITRHDNKDWLELSVEDNGIGIKKDDHERIFEEFQMVDNTLSKRQQGTGLGLALSRRLARLHGGDILVVSEEGKGSTFTLTLPLDEAALSALKPEVKSSAEPAGKTRHSQRKMALVIEDEDQAAELLSHYMQQAGYSVTRVSNGEQALQKARELQPSVITLDIILPQKNGWDVLRELKQEPATRDIPVLVVSMVDNCESSFALGAVACFVKPVRKEELLHKLHDLQLKERRQFRQKHRPELRKNGEPLQALVIDDNINDRELIGAVLSSAGLNVRMAENGEAGWTLAQQDPPDLVVLDLMMPGMDGFSVLRRLRQNMTTLDVPVFVYTAKDLDANEKKQLRQAEAVLQKGDFSSQRLLEAVSHLQPK
ncbi:MAG TPA: response regulator [Chloroflexia bacterium]|nr:response regulator [Chloroflexia bacterium]